MANEFVVEVDKVKSWFLKVFAKAPKATAAALSVLNTAAPLFEAVVAVTDPAAALIIDPIVTVIQADLGTVSQLLATGNITSVSSFLVAIKNNFSTLLTEGHVSDTASVAKANVFLSVLQSIAGDIGATI
jgi:hypothetical protein